MRIAVDAMGGDFAPDQVVLGAAQAAVEYGIDISLVGLPSVVQPLLDSHPRLQLVPCTQVIGMEEHPAQAVRAKLDSSMSVCARMCREHRADGWISAGNSGAIMAAALLFSGEAAAVEASIGWLLDPATLVRQSIANALEDAARKGMLTPTSLRRMITMRNWLPEDSRAALDAAVATARRKGVSPAQWDDVEVRQLVTTGVDGSGAIGVLAHCRNKRKNVLGSLVLKHGFGVRDAWAQDQIKQKEIDGAFAEASLMDQFTISPDFIRRAVGHFLALGHQTGLMPPFGLVRFLEAVGVSSVQPELISASSLLDTIQEGCAIGADAFEDLLAEGYNLGDHYFLMESWFEAGDIVHEVLKGNRDAPAKREARIMEKVLQPRREWWTQAAAWMAYILYQSGNDERWQDFYAATLAMVQGRPLDQIALMKKVAEQTIMASEG